MFGDYIDRTLRAYNASPQKYEAATQGMTPQAEVDEFVNALPNTELPVLDAGCAFGRDSALFTQRGLSAVGIDMSEKLLDRAKELYPQLAFKKMDIRKLDFDDESFRGVWCHATLLHLNDQDTKLALAELKRVLAPGGLLFISLKEGTGEEELVEKFSSNSSRYFNYQTLETTRALLEEAGFMIKRIYSINEREKFGPDKRDLNWVYCYAVK